MVYREPYVHILSNSKYNIEYVMHNSFVFLKVQKFLKLQGKSLARDVIRIQQIFMKENFARKALENLTKESEEISEDLNLQIFFDGMDNFVNGIPLFSLYALFQNNFIVYDPINYQTYAGNDKRFFVNDSFIRTDERNIKSIKTFHNSHIPVTLLVCWFLTHSIDLITIENPHPITNFLQNTPSISNKIFFHKYISNHKDFNKIIEQKSKELKL